jgi:hypothetical protein
VKRVDLIKTIKGLGCVLVRSKGKHDWYRNPVTGVAQPQHPIFPRSPNPAVSLRWLTLNLLP